MAYRVFVSHVWRAQHDHYWGLIRLLAQAKRFKFVDLSVPKLRPLDGDYDDVRDTILETLRSADVVLVINTPILRRSAAVQDELREANANGIPVIVIKPPRGNANGSTLEAVARAHQAKWTTQSIVDAIRQAAKVRARRNKAAGELITEPAYESVLTAAEDSPLLPAQIEAVRGDDERSVSPAPVVAPEPLNDGAKTADERPRDVLYNDAGKQPVLAPRKSWIMKLLFR